MSSSTINLTDSYQDDPMESRYYEPWSRVASHTILPTNFRPLQPMTCCTTHLSQLPCVVSSLVTATPQSSFTLVNSRSRSHQPRKRSILPEIIIERRRHHHSSSRQHQIIRIPLENDPILGPHGPPKKMLEIECIPRRRHHKRYSSCYEVSRNIPSLMSIQPQSNPVVANSTPNSCFPTVQSTLSTSVGNSTGSLTLCSNVTSEAGENLPKKPVHLPSVHLPNSRAGANAELRTIIFPAEFINPVHQTPSIIQSNSTSTGDQVVNVAARVPVPAQTPLINVQTNSKSSASPLPTISGPFTQQIRSLFQRLDLSSRQPALLYSNDASVQSSIPVLTPHNALTNALHRSQAIPPVNARNRGSYPLTNIPPTNILNSRRHNQTNFTPYSSSHNVLHRPSGITPYHSFNDASSSPEKMTSNHSTNITPYPPANITPYDSVSFGSPNSTNTRAHHLTSIVPHNISDSKLYHPTNITLRSPAYNRSSGSSTLPSSVSSVPDPYSSSSSFSSSDSFNSHSSDVDNSPINTSFTPQPLSKSPDQSKETIPRSILRNATSNDVSHVTYTR